MYFQLFDSYVHSYVQISKSDLIIRAMFPIRKTVVCVCETHACANFLL